MSNEKYVNYYIETLTNTITEAVIRNISFQANAKVTDDVIKEQSKAIEDLRLSNNELVEKLEIEKNLSVQNENSKTQALESDIKNYIVRITDLQAEVKQMQSIKSDYDNVKSQVQHLDTYRNELVKARAELETTRNSYEDKIKVLNGTIENLKTPVKKKKADVVKTVTTVSSNSIKDETIRDGGVF